MVSQSLVVPAGLRSHYLSCEKSHSSRFPVVLLSGWGMCARVWQAFTPRLTEHFDVIVVDLPGYGDNDGIGFSFTCQDDLAALSKMLLSVLPEKFILLGWSMGGMIAGYIASHYPSRLQGLITVASNPCYVQRDNWSHAMSLSDFKGFKKKLTSNALLTLQQFVGMQCVGSRDERQLLRQLRSYIMPVDIDVLRNGLDLLAQCDQRSCYQSNVDVPVLHILGGEDQLVPVDIAHDLVELNANHKVVVIAEAGHAVFISHGGLVVENIVAFVNESVGDSESALDKKDIARSFSLAAKSYDGAAGFQCRVANELLSRAPPFTKSGKLIDLGCGTGLITEQIAKRYRQAQVYGLDLAFGMLDYSRYCRSSVSGWLCGDVERLPFADNSVDFIYSSLALQWCSSVDRYLEEAKRVLSADGIFLFATLGPKTFYELRQAWGDVDGYSHVNRFTDMKRLTDSIRAHGFAIESLDHSFELQHYEKVDQFARELKALGANNINKGRAKGLTGKSKYQKFIDSYEKFRQSNGMLPVTYEVLWICLRR